MPIEPTTPASAGPSPAPTSGNPTPLFAALLAILLLAGIAFAFVLNPAPAPGVVMPPLKPTFAPDAIVLAEDFFPSEVEIKTLGEGTEIVLELDVDYDHDDCSDIGDGTALELAEGCRYWMEVAYLHDDWLVTAYMYAYDEPSQARQAAEAVQTEEVDWLDLDLSTSATQQGWHWWNTTHVGRFGLLVCAGPAESARSEDELPEEARDVMEAFKSWALSELIVRT